MRRCEWVDLFGNTTPIGWWILFNTKNNGNRSIANKHHKEKMKIILKTSAWIFGRDADGSRRYMKVMTFDIEVSNDIKSSFFFNLDFSPKLFCWNSTYVLKVTMTYLARWVTINVKEKERQKLPFTEGGGVEMNSCLDYFTTGVLSSHEKTWGVVVMDSCLDSFTTGVISSHKKTWDVLSCFFFFVLTMRKLVNIMLPILFLVIIDAHSLFRKAALLCTSLFARVSALVIGFFKKKF